MSVSWTHLWTPRGWGPATTQAGASDPGIASPGGDALASPPQVAFHCELSAWLNSSRRPCSLSQADLMPQKPFLAPALASVLEETPAPARLLRIAGLTEPCVLLVWRLWGDMGTLPGRGDGL